MIEASPKKIIIFKWLVWHFFEVPKKILQGFGNYLVFNINYFSIPQLLKTLFSHWRRYREFYGRGFDPKRYLEVFLSNTVSRILGAIIRIITIMIGLIFEFFIFLGGIFIFIIWVLLPLIIILCFFSGFKLLI